MSEEFRYDGPLLSFQHIEHVYRAKNGRSVRALNDVSLDVLAGETLGIVGESGCGKSTLAKIGSRLQLPTSGEVLFKGHNVGQKIYGQLVREFRNSVQMVFQDPNDSLDPRYTILHTVAETLTVSGVGGREARQRAGQVLERVGFTSDDFNRRPHEFSGGQKQRVAIARALVVKPELVILDEPTSALDVSIQAQILNLLVDLQSEERLTYIFITHNMAVVRHMAHRVAVMHQGKVVEIGPSRQVLDSPTDSYTVDLMSAVPTMKYTMEATE